MNSENEKESQQQLNQEFFHKQRTQRIMQEGITSIFDKLSMSSKSKENLDIIDILITGAAKTTLGLLKCMQEKKLEEINIINQIRHREALMLEQQLNQSKLFGGSFKKQIASNTVDKNSLSVGSAKYKSP